MPSIVIHEEVGYFLSKKINKNSYEYYLGLLAPDTPNLYGFGAKEERWTAHVRKEDLGEWRESLKDFYKEKKKTENEDFLLGYVIHILTDIVFDDYLYKKVRKIIKEEKSCSKKEAHNWMRLDMLKYHFQNQEEVYDILQKGRTSFDIQNISKEKLLKWKEKQILEKREENSSIYITTQIIDTLNILVEQELKEIEEAVN